MVVYSPNGTNTGFSIILLSVKFVSSPYSYRTQTIVLDHSEMHNTNGHLKKKALLSFISFSFKMTLS